MPENQVLIVPRPQFSVWRRCFRHTRHLQGTSLLRWPARVPLQRVQALLCVAIPRTQSQCLAEFCHSGVGLSGLDERSSETQMSGCIGGINLDRAPERCHGAVPPPNGAQRVSKIEISLRQHWIQSYGSFEIPDGRLHTVPVSQQDPEVVVCRCKGRIGPEGLVQLGLSVLHATLFHVKMPQVVLRLRVNGPR